MTATLIFNVILSAALFATVVSVIAWAIVTQHRDTGTAFARKPRRVRRASARPKFQRSPVRA